MRITIQATPEEARTKRAVALHAVARRLDGLVAGHLAKSDEPGGMPRRLRQWRELIVNVETDAGETREWKDPATGRSGRTTMLFPYGEVIGSVGADGDPVDVFLGPNENAPFAFIVHQRRLDTQTYDEDKVMLGFDTPLAAKHAFMAHYDNPLFFMGISMVPYTTFLRGVMRTGVLLDPASDGVSRDAETAADGSEAELLFLTKAERLVKVKAGSGGMRPGGEAADTESVHDGLTGHTEMPADLRERLAAIPELHGLLEVPVAGTGVASAVFGTGKHLQIGDGVVCPIPVAVVDDLVLGQLTTEVRLHEHPMLQSALAANENKPVSILVRSIDPNFVIGPHEPDRNVHTGATGINILVAAPRLEQHENIGAMRANIAELAQRETPNKRTDVVERLLEIPGARVQPVMPVPRPTEWASGAGSSRTALAAGVHERATTRAAERHDARAQVQPRFVIKQTPD